MTMFDRVLLSNGSVFSLLKPMDIEQYTAMVEDGGWVTLSNGMHISDDFVAYYFTVGEEATGALVQEMLHKYVNPLELA